MAREGGEELSASWREMKGGREEKRMGPGIGDSSWPSELRFVIADGWREGALHVSSSPGQR